LTDSTLVKVRLLIKRTRELIGVVHRSSNVNDYIQEQSKQNKELIGDVSNA
jgi:hypothetical protein